MKIKKLTREKIQFSIEPEQDHESIYQALSFEFTGADHSEYIQKFEDDNGNNPWLWCTVKVTARLGSLEGVAYLGGCAYESEEDFKRGGYYEQMQDEAFSDLEKQLQPIVNALKVPTLSERVTTFFRTIRARLSWLDLLMALPAMTALFKTTNYGNDQSEKRFV